MLLKDKETLEYVYAVLLLVKHFLLLQVGNKQETLTGEPLVEMKEGSLFETVAY